MFAELASERRRTCRALVWEDPRFTDYFRHATPIDAIERMTIGSRPASRRSAWRAGDRTDGPLLEALLETVNGIAQGLQNTG